MKQVRTYCGYFWAILFFAQLLTMVKLSLPYFSYQLNYDYISTVLCENISKPELQRNGQCYLKKELKKAGEEEQKNTQKTSFQTQSIELLMPDFAPDLSYSAYTISEIIHTTFVRTAINSGFAGQLTPPPQYAACTAALLS